MDASRVTPVVAGLPEKVEVARRGHLVTLINHGDEAVEILLEGTDAETGEPVGRRTLETQAVLFALAPVAAVGSADDPALRDDGSHDDAVALTTP